MKITDMHIYPVSGSLSTVALVSLVFDGSMAINELRLLRRSDGRYILQWPVSQHSGLRPRYIANPINSELQAQVSEAVIAAYLAAIS